MDDLEIKKEPPLPPDYVSLAQLQERWLQKQQEKKLKEKQQQEEEDKKRQREMETQNENKNQRGVEASNGHAKMEGGSIRDVPRRGIQKYGRVMSVIEEKGKGKEIEIGGSENGEKKKLKKKKKNRPRFRNKKSENGTNNKKPMSEIKNYNEGFDGFKGVEIISRNEVKTGISGGSSGENSVRGRNSDELKGTEETVSVAMVEVLPRNVGYRGGVSRNGENRGSAYKGKREYIVKQHEVKNNEVGLDSKKKMENGKLYGKKWSEKKVYGTNGEKGYSSKEINEDEILDVDGEVDGSKGKERNGLSGQRRNMRNKIKDNSVDGGEKCEGGNELRRFGGLTLNDRRADIRSNVGESKRYGRFGNRREMKQRDSNSSSMVWVKKEVKSEVDYSGTLVDQE